MELEKKLTKNKDTIENRRFWDTAEKASAIVAKWAKWKRPTQRLNS